MNHYQLSVRYVCHGLFTCHGLCVSQRWPGFISPPGKCFPESTTQKRLQTPGVASESLQEVSEELGRKIHWPIPGDRASFSKAMSEETQGYAET